MRTDDEILRELDQRFGGNSAVRSIPLHLASPTPAGKLDPKPSVNIHHNPRFSIASGPVLLRSAKAPIATPKPQEKQEKPRKNTAWERKSYERLPANQLPESVKGCKT